MQQRKRTTESKGNGGKAISLSNRSLRVRVQVHFLCRQPHLRCTEYAHLNSNRNGRGWGPRAPAAIFAPRREAKCAMTFCFRHQRCRLRPLRHHPPPHRPRLASASHARRRPPRPPRPQTATPPPAPADGHPAPRDRRRPPCPQRPLTAIPRPPPARDWRLPRNWRPPARPLPANPWAATAGRL